MMNKALLPHYCKTDVSGSLNLIHALQFAEWIAERYNYIGGEWCCWCAKQYDINDTERYRNTSELFGYWMELPKPPKFK